MNLKSEPMPNERQVDRAQSREKNRAGKLSSQEMTNLGVQALDHDLFGVLREARGVNDLLHVLLHEFLTSRVVLLPVGEGSADACPHLSIVLVNSHQILSVECISRSIDRMEVDWTVGKAAEHTVVAIRVLRQIGLVREQCLDVGKIVWHV